MSRREDNRSLATRIAQGVAKGLFITAIGVGLMSLFGDLGIPARVLGVLGAMAVSGTAVIVSDYAAAAERRRCEEKSRAVELEDRLVDAFVAEQEVARTLSGFTKDQSTPGESRFAQLIDAQRNHTTSRERGV